MSGVQSLWSDGDDDWGVGQGSGEAAEWGGAACEYWQANSQHASLYRGSTRTSGAAGSGRRVVSGWSRAGTRILGEKGADGGAVCTRSIHRGSAQPIRRGSALCLPARGGAAIPDGGSGEAE